MILTAACLLALSSCDQHDSTHTFADRVQSPLTEPLTDGVHGGVLTVVDGAGLSSVDPARAHSRLEYEVMAATQRPLFSRRPNALAISTPDLAAGRAVISTNGMVLTVHIRHGVFFSPPLSREVTSADVAYAIERGANPHVSNPYFHTYFSSVEGAPEAKGGHLPGLATPNRSTIVFHLTTRAAQTVLDALTLPLSAPVPEEFAKRYDSRSPSRYGDYQVATGPYMLKSSGRGRVLGVGYIPGKSATLVRNPSWRPNSDFRPAYLDAIRNKFVSDRDASGDEVLNGSGLVQNDPTAPIVRLAYKGFRGQLQVSPDVGISFIALNNTHGPFSDPDVRKAYWAALDRVAMNRALGGGLVSRLATHFLYPGIPGFERASLLVASRALAYNVHPRGDIAVAENYMRHAGYPNGHYSGSDTMRVVGATGNPAAKIARLADNTLRTLGFRTSLRLVPESLMYSRYCEVPAREIDVCPSVSWRADFGDGQAVLDAPFNGKTIRPIGNDNWGQVNDPDINAAIEREGLLVGSRPREEGWAAVDNGLVGNAVAIPFAWTSEAALESKNVVGVGELWNAGAWDYSFTSLK